MWINEQPFFSAFAQNRVVSIAGAPGAYKSCMGMDVMRPYLNQGYALSSSVNTVWSDPLTYSLEEWVRDSPVFQRIKKQGRDPLEVARSLGLPEVMPWVFRRCFVLDEGGDDLRVWKYFADIKKYPRKFRTYFSIPSTKLAHDDLTTLTVFPTAMFENYIPGWKWGGGVYYWSWETGSKRSIDGNFIYIPESIGLFDTDDLAQDSLPVIESFTRAIEYRQLEYGRTLAKNGLSALGETAESSDMEIQQNISRALVRSNRALSDQIRGRAR